MVIMQSEVYWNSTQMSISGEHGEVITMVEYYH